MTQTTPVLYESPTLRDVQRAHMPAAMDFAGMVGYLSRAAVNEGWLNRLPIWEES